MTIRTVSFTGILLAGLSAPCLAQEATLPPHSLDFDKSVEPESIVIQDLSDTGMQQADTAYKAALGAAATASKVSLMDYL